MGRPRKVLAIDFNELDEKLNNGERIEMKGLAEKFGTCPPVIRRALREHYGDSITFRPGRNGGVVKVPISAGSTPAAETA